MKDSVLQRIEMIIKNKDMSIRAFAGKIGMAQTTVNNYLLEKRKVSFELIESIINSFEDISVEWLVTGRGEMIKNIFENNVNLTELSEDDVRNSRLQELLTSKIEQTIMNEIPNIIKAVGEIMKDQQQGYNQVIFNQIETLQNVVTKALDKLDSKAAEIDSKTSKLIKLSERKIG